MGKYEMSEKEKYKEMLIKEEERHKKLLILKKKEWGFAFDIIMFTIQRHLNNYTHNIKCDVNSKSTLINNNKKYYSIKAKNDEMEKVQDEIKGLFTKEQNKIFKNLKTDEEKEEYLNGVMMSKISLLFNNIN